MGHILGLDEISDLGQTSAVEAIAKSVSGQDHIETIVNEESDQVEGKH